MLLLMSLNLTILMNLYWWFSLGLILHHLVLHGRLLSTLRHLHHISVSCHHILSLMGILRRILEILFSAIILLSKLSLIWLKIISSKIHRLYLILRVHWHLRHLLEILWLGCCILSHKLLVLLHLSLLLLLVTHVTGLIHLLLILVI